jgi:hypothetical protein
MRVHDLQGRCLLWAGTSRDSLYPVLASQLKEFKIDTNKFFSVEEGTLAVDYPSAAKLIRMEILRYIAAKADLFREENKLKTDAELDAASQRFGFRAACVHIISLIPSYRHYSKVWSLDRIV